MTLSGILKIFCLSVVTFIFTFSPASTKKYNLSHESIQIDKTILKSGDLIFRKGLSFVSNMVMLADKRCSFSHVGLIYLNDSDVYVIHTTPDESEDGIDKVKLDRLEDYLRIDRATATSVYRLQDSLRVLYAESSIENALEFFHQKILFDAALDLTESDKLYCTELVWKAYKDSGIDLIDSKFDNLNIPLGKGKYILPGTLLNSPFLKSIVLNTMHKEER